MLKLALLACVVAMAAAQTHHTHPPRPTHQAAHHNPNVHGSFLFFYDKPMGDLVLETKTHCYLMALNDQQKNQAKDTLKLEALELELSVLAADPSKHVTGTIQPDKQINARCHDRTIVQVQA